MSQRRLLDFIYFDAGGGHRSAALALQSVIASEGYDWKVRLINLQEVLDPLDIFRRITGIRMQDIYNLLLAKGWTLGSSYLLPMMHAIIRVYHRDQVRLLRKFWKGERPDMVVSLVPNFNRALFTSLQQELLDTPFVTVLTDFADYPPHFWMERQPEQYFVCGTSRAVEQANRVGHPASRIFKVSGMILRPQFYEPQIADAAAERVRLGLSADLPTCLVLFGGEGSNVMFSIAERLGNSSLNVQLIMICGRNKKLKARLEAMKTRNKLVIEGFTREIPRFMHLSDFFIGKPGPGSITEALKMNLPVIVERNSWTLPQETYNADWVSEHQTGIVLSNFREIERAVGQLLADGQLERMKQHISGMNNRAVFEVPRVLQKILQEHKISLVPDQTSLHV